MKLFIFISVSSLSIILKTTQKGCKETIPFAASPNKKPC
jgi:hypothetical protein